MSSTSESEPAPSESLQSDIIGQVARLPLRPSDANALLPLFEAVSNSLYAIQERFGDEELGDKGRIDIEVLRAPGGDDTSKVDGFRVTDNGIGLNEANYRSFLTPFSQHKMTRGGKGVGRLGWLKVFETIHIDSAYSANGVIQRRAFNFVLLPKDQIAFTDPTTIRSDLGTIVTLERFIEAFGPRCPQETDTLVQRIIGHFLPVFAGGKSPKLYLHDDGIVDLQQRFDDGIVEQVESLIDIEIDGEKQPILVRHMRCDKSIRPRGSNYNWMCLCANDRGVKEYGIDDQIGLKLLDNEEIYVGTVTGDYLDAHVNPQRTDFIFDVEEGRLIRRQVAESVRGFLTGYIEKALAQKKAIAKSLIQKNPQYLYLTGELDVFVEGLQANSNNEETIYLEMSQDRFRRQRRFNVVKKDIEKAPIYDQALAEKVEEYRSYILDDQKGTLAEYVTKRKAVLDLLDKLRGFEGPESEKYPLEDAVHQLICPMRIDSNGLTIDDHNLWILDDRLAFFSFFASDRPINQYTEAESGREPDLAFFYDSCVAWRESERSCDTVILVEFKRPGLEHYTDKNDPMMQLMDYVTHFQSGKTVRDKGGKVISGIGSNTAFQCYIVADITEGLQKRLRGHFQPTPDGKGLFGYARNPDAYVEVIPYDKLLTDAQARNSIFFEKLGLNG